MYIPSAFASPDEEAALRLIDENGFGHLIAHGPDGLIASHVPMQLDRQRRVLVGHLAGPNPHGAALAACADSGTQVLAIFSGPHGYVSPAWYQPSNKAVPTWNYAATHVYGVPRVTRDKAVLRGLLDALSRQYERHGWTLDAQEPGFIDAMLGAIVGFEIPLTRVEGKFKLSQNRKLEDRQGVIAGLAATRRADDAALAALMKNPPAKG